MIGYFVGFDLVYQVSFGLRDNHYRKVEMSIYVNLLR